MVSLPTERKAHFRNPQGYRLLMVVGSSELFIFCLDMLYPLTWVDGDGEWQPDRRYMTDRGSIPGIVTRFPGYERNRLAYLMHDSAYNDDGSGHGLWWRACETGCNTFRALTRQEADDLMRRMLIAEGVPASTARVIWAAVRVFGRRW